MNYLLDTCVISEIRKKTADSNVVSWVQAKSMSQLYLSVITLGEIQSGIKQKIKDPAQQEMLSDWLANNLLPRFSNRLLDINLQTAMIWGSLVGSGKASGASVSVVDALIAATAISNDLAIVTRNVSDFSRFSVTVVNPWVK